MDFYASASPGLDIIDTQCCDESKCVSRALSDEYGGSFTCYGGDDDTLYPRMCADGFLPVVLEDEPTKLATVETDDGDTTTIDLSYYTCCAPEQQPNGHDLKKNMLHLPPQQEEPTAATARATPRRRCSDPIAGFRTNDACDHEEGDRKYSVAMKPNISPENVGLRETESVMCCDYRSLERQEIDGIGTDVLDNDTECVPYRSRFYEDFRAINEPGLLRPRTCDFPEGSFVYPRPLEGVDPSTGRYQCCKTGPGLLPFQKDATFGSFVYPSLAIHCLALIITGLVAIALLLPLLSQLYQQYKMGSLFNPNQEKMHSKASRSSVSITTATSDSLMSRKWVSSSGKSKSKYSTYNLYLVYLLLADFVYLMYEIEIFSNYINQHFRLEYWGLWVCKSDLTDLNTFLSRSKAIIGPYLFINLWINCVITHEILALLKASRKAKRIKSPSLTRVNLQVLVGAILSIGVGFSTYYFVIAIENAMDDEAYHRIKDLEKYAILVICMWTVLPIAHVLCVTILIWWKKYIPSKVSGNSSKRARGVRELSYYVCRIVACFVGIWIPVIGLTLSASDKPWGMVLCNVLAAIQPLLTAGMVLTKSDTRKYVRDFCGKLLCCYNTGSSGNDSQSIQIHGDRTTRIGNRSSLANHTSMGTSQWSNFSIDLEIDLDAELAGDDDEEDKDPSPSDCEDDEESQEMAEQCVAVSNGGLDTTGSSMFLKPASEAENGGGSSAFLKADPIHDAKIDIGDDTMPEIDDSFRTQPETIDNDTTLRTTVDSIDASAHTTTSAQQEGAIDASAHTTSSDAMNTSIRSTSLSK